jgi:hypothetical protein
LKYGIPLGGFVEVCKLSVLVHHLRGSRGETTEQKKGEAVFSTYRIEEKPAQNALEH